MPVHSGSDSNGSYMQWGESGKKYYYTKGNANSKSRAKGRAEKQGQAAYAKDIKESK